ncbi:hypothetical protein BU17DRAFT_79864 [Hysterangium stoloniferum]|nr:hypothetical protein BU17DRAFT_79864 [Hysterangium stoloniferum]
MELEIGNNTRDRPDSRLGIKVLVEGISPNIDIVAIHGLDGHREQSWTAENGTLWLKDLLPQRFPHARVATYGYDASTGSQSNKINETLYGHAENFISRLALLRNKTTTTTRPIIFLAHSLGGIILKFALIHANQCNNSHLSYHKRIMRSTIGILFFGTPHQGTAVALSASQMLRVLLPVKENTAHALLCDLASNSNMLEIQLSLYNGISASFTTKFLYEVYQTVLHDGTSSFIVPKSSAVVPGARNAEAIGLNRNHMDMVKFSSVEEDDFDVVVSLLESMGNDPSKSEPENGKNLSRSEDIHEGPCYRRKLFSSPRFTGQDMYLDRLRTFFIHENIVTSRKHLLLYGMGGIGKTQISLKFAEECADLKLYWRILWLDATTAESLLTSFTEISKRDPVIKSLKIEESGEAIIEWLAGLGRKCLLVFDNADGMTTLVSKLLPPAHSLDVLITSRNPDLQQSVGSTLKLEVMSKEDAFSLLKKSSLREGKTDVLLENGELQAITEALDFLPLALDVAGAALYTKLCTLEEYMSTYLKNQQIILHRDHPLYKGASLYNQTVCETLNISYDLIDKKSVQGDVAKDALFLLKMLGFFHHQDIMEEIFKRAAKAPEWYIQDSRLRNTRQDLPIQFLKCDKNCEWIPTRFRTAMQLLCDYSLISHIPSRLSWSIHPVVQIWARDKVVNENQGIYLAAARALIVNSINVHEDLVGHLQHFDRMILPHLMAYYNYSVEAELCYFDDEQCAHITELIKNCYWERGSRLCQQVWAIRKWILGPEHQHSILMMAEMAHIWRKWGKYNEAQGLEVQVLEAHKQFLGPEHPNTLNAMANLAWTLGNLAEYTEAQKLEILVLQEWKKCLGPEHPDTLWIMGNLAGTLRNLGKYTEAQGLEVQALETCREFLGPDHRDTLHAMANLACTLWRLGKYTEAQELQVQVLEGRKQCLGPEHPDTLCIMGNLADTLRNLGKYTKAQGLEVQVLEAHKQFFGPEHPNTLNAMANLACTLRNLGKYAEAQELEIQVLEGRKKCLGPEHPDTLWIMGNLAGTLRNLGKYTEAQGLEVQALETCREFLGPDHQCTLHAMANLACTLGSLGKYTEAQVLQVQVLEGYKQCLGPEHPHTLWVMGNLANTLQNLGKYTEAQGLEVQALEICREFLGPDHQCTLHAMANLACTLGSLGKYTEAQELQVQVLEGYKQCLGPEHPHTLWVMVNLADTLQNLGKYTEAQGLQMQVLEAHKQFLGPEHPNTLNAMANLACTLQNLGKYAEAQELEIQVLEGRKKCLGPEHPDTLWIMGNLAGTLRNLGKYTEAQGLEVQALETCREFLRPDNQCTLHAMANLAYTLGSLGKYTEAQELQVQVLEGYKQCLGPEHPHTLWVMGNLADTLQNLGKYTEAQGLQMQVLEAHKQFLGPEHPNTLNAMTNLACTLWIMENLAGTLYTEAQGLEVHVLETCREFLGPDH